MKIPRCMSTQHPDNVNVPFFAREQKIGGEDEIKEAYYTYSHLGIDEQMWDVEGKEVDNYVVKKLLTTYEHFFREHILGEDVFLTLRVPNPVEERAEAKILLETLESIPRSFDASALFYGRDVAPIFEVILPMTDSASSIDHIYRYYKDFIVGRQDKVFKKGDITIGEWIGQFKPAAVNVIPLMEDLYHQLSADTIVREYLSDKKDVTDQRVFLARSDPAMNYGTFGAVVSNKIALMRLEALSREIGVRLHPILGAGSAPFRGNLSPRTARRFTREYPSVETFTLQSAFKYDYPLDEIREAVRFLENDFEPGRPTPIDAESALKLTEEYTKVYQMQVKELAPVVNKMAKFIPKRRDRKLHTGLFGYARSLDGVTLPRAISFTASLYSLGCPPELLGLTAFTPATYSRAREVYHFFEEDLRDALRGLNPDSPYLPHGLLAKLDELGIRYEVDPQQKQLTDQILKTLADGRTERTTELVLMAGQARQFLG
ncbi:MAG: phosphoenolpyruvate carboxylase [Spirochaetales bacterium]